MQINPINWFDLNGSFKEIFSEDKTVSMLTDNEYTGLDPTDMSTGLIFKNIPGHGLVEVKRNNKWKIPVGMITKFTLLTEVKFKSNWQAAASYVSHYLMGEKTKYIRVGADYYKIVTKRDRAKILQTSFKLWKKDEITQDHGKGIFSLIPRYDDFTIEPNNKEYLPVIDNNYNQYSKFAHEPVSKIITEDDIPVTINFLKHIFSEEKLHLGLRYFKVLYEFPQQILPILVLVSKERETGKTTFINLISMIFGANSVLIAPEEINKNHNSLYANKNIIMIDEAGKEKEVAMEKLKALSTAKQISVDPKFVQQYQIPFFGKAILCTNKEKDFMRIDDEEIRFWVRKIKKIEGKKNNKIEEQLKEEIPFFLKYLEQQHDIDFDNGSRMIFTKEEIETDSLKIIKAESKSNMHKELEIKFEDYFHNNDYNELQVTPGDIKDRWFSTNNQITSHYIGKVLRDEMKIEFSEKPVNYKKWNDPIERKKGAVYTVRRLIEAVEEPVKENIDNINYKEEPFNSELF